MAKKVAVKSAGSRSIKLKSNEFDSAVRRQVKQWAKEKPDEVVVGAASVGKPLTRKDISRHVNKDTAIGQRLVKGWMDAAVRSVLGAKVKK